MVLRRISVATVLALATVLLSACSSTEKEPTFVTRGGDETAEAMLPDARVFPGAGWRTLPGAENDEEDDSDACSGLDGAFSDLDHRLQEKLENPAGTAAREYELDGSNDAIPFPVTIELETEVHEDRNAVEEGISAFDTLLHSPEFEACLRDSMQLGAAEGGAEGVAVDAKVSGASAAAPREGTGLALDAKISAADVAIDVRMEFYAWRIGNAAAFVFISGAKDDVTEEFVRNVLERIDGAAMIAAKKN